jgi:hypothetical protein
MRGVARRFIPEMLQKGWTTGAALSYLKKEGLGYRRKDFLLDWRQFAGTARKRDPLKAIPKKYKPTWDTIQMSETRQAAKLHYSYKIEGYDTFTGKKTEEWITVASDQVLTMKEAEEEAKRLLERYKSELIIEKIGIDSVTSNIGQLKT